MFGLPWPFNRQTKSYKERRQPEKNYYRTQYRFDEVSVQWMSDHFLGPGSGEKRGGALSNKQKMEVCLRFMADPGFQNGVSEVVGISQPTVSRTVKQVVETICLKSNRWIIFPGNQRAVNELSTLWILSRKLPGCFRAVDGSLIKVQVPPSTSNTPQDFYSGRKKVYCLNVMLVCSADCKFIAVDARWPGRAHDARVWRTSDVHARQTNGVSGDKYLIGDSASPISTHLLKPFTQQEAANDQVKRNFNKVHTVDILAAFLLDLSTKNKAQVHLENVLHAIFIKSDSSSFF